MRFISFMIEDYYRDVAPLNKRRGELMQRARTAEGKAKVKVNTEIAEIEKKIKSIAREMKSRVGGKAIEEAKKEIPSRDTEGEKQTEVVMKQFHKGKLKAYGGGKVTDMKQAKAIAMSEKRATEKQGRGQRDYKGEKRMRPHLKKGKD